MSTNTAADLQTMERSAFLQIFGDKTLPLPISEQAQATYIAGEQARAWDDLHNIITEAIGPTAPHVKAAAELTRRISKGLAQGVVTQNGQTVVIQSPLPIIKPSEIERFRNFIRKDAWFCYANVIFEIFTVLKEINNRVLDQIAEFPGFFDPRLMVSLLDAAETRSSIQGQAMALISELATKRSEIEEVKARADALEEEHKAAFGKREVEWTQLLNEGKSQIEALKGQVAESIRLSANRNLWIGRTRYHQRWMLISFGVMTIGVAATVALITFVALPALEPTFIEMLTRQSYLTPKLILIVLCVIAVAWVLRFVARSIADNMTLRADAAHRQSMLDTYLAMRGEALMSDADRSLILNALFRPLPGQSSEDLNPPMPALEALKQLFGK